METVEVASQVGENLERRVDVTSEAVAGRGGSVDGAATVGLGGEEPLVLSQPVDDAAALFGRGRPAPDVPRELQADEFGVALEATVAPSSRPVANAFIG